MECFIEFKKQLLNFPQEFMEASSIAGQLKEYLRSELVSAEINKCHKINATSHEIQKIIDKEVQRLGFHSEKRGLFGDMVKALRPDFYRRVGKSGIILEVERGKTITNNMDLLDLWKCHICPYADFLYLIVPIERHSKNGNTIKAFEVARRRLSTFFEPKNYVNVEAVFLFGY
jgi:hypothetical protein